LFTDTDSLCYEIETEDFYKDISAEVQKKFDTSNFSPNHPSGIPTGINKKVPGMFKDEAGGEIITEFVGLRAKLYAFKTLKGEEEKRCKGVKRRVVKKSISFEDFKECVFSGRQQLRTMNIIQSHKHEIFTEQVKKIALSVNDDKRIILPNRINTLAYGFQAKPQHRQRSHALADTAARDTRRQRGTRRRTWPGKRRTDRGLKEQGDLTRGIEVSAGKGQGGTDTRHRRDRGLSCCWQGTREADWEQRETGAKCPKALY